MQKKMLVFAGIVLCLLILAATGFYWYQKPRASLANVRPAYTISAKELYNAFQQNEQKANQQYMGKVIQVKGAVDNVQVTDSTLSILLIAPDEMGGVNCNIAKSKKGQQALPTKGAVIQVKGKCVGFLMDVNLVDAVIEP